MRIGILSDIHSNVEALTETLAGGREAQPDLLVCLGDVVGYGASPNECCELIRKSCAVTLARQPRRGRRRPDGLLVLLRRRPPRARLDLGAARAGAPRLAQAPLPTCTRGGRRLLPRLADRPRRRSSTSSPSSRPRAAAAPGAAPRGHLHRPLPPLQVASRCTARTRSTRWWPRAFALRRGYKYIISVGSVGQPRDYDNRACFVIYDTTRG